MLNTTDKIIKHKVGLLNLAEELGNVSKACKVMGLSGDTFYRYKSAVDTGSVDALFDQNRRKPNIKNRVDEPVEQAVIEYAIKFLTSVKKILSRRSLSFLSSMTVRAKSMMYTSWQCF